MRIKNPQLLSSGFGIPNRIKVIPYPQAGWALTFFIHGLYIFKGIHECFAFQQQKKGSKTRPYRTVRSGGNAAADEKITENHCIPLKENNSLRSNRFSFLTLHELIFLTYFFKLFHRARGSIRFGSPSLVRFLARQEMNEKIISS